jgi:hypothetical protein
MAPPKSNEPGYCYSIDHPSSQPPQPLMLPPPPPNYPSALPSQAPYVAQQAKPPTPSQTPIDPLEQRILDLLYPYRDECFRTEDGTIVARERIALILCGTFFACCFQLLSPSPLYELHDTELIIDREHRFPDPP